MPKRLLSVVVNGRAREDAVAQPVEPAGKLTLSQPHRDALQPLGKAGRTHACRIESRLLEPPQLALRAGAQAARQQLDQIVGPHVGPIEDRGRVEFQTPELVERHRGLPAVLVARVDHRHRGWTLGHRRLATIDS